MSRSLTASDLHGNSFNHIYLYGEVTVDSVKCIRRDLEALSKPIVIDVNGVPIVSTPVPILLHINSPGGDLSAGLSAISAIQNCPVPVYTVVDGSAMSAAATILAAGHRRFAFAMSAVLIHQHWSFNSGVVRHEDVMSESVLSQAMYDQYKRYFLTKTKLKEKELDDLLLHDRVLSATEAKKMGLIDEIIASTQLKVVKEFAKHNYQAGLSNTDLKTKQAKPNKANARKHLNTLTLSGAEGDPFRTPLPTVQAIAAINKMATGNMMFPTGDGVRLYSGTPRPIKLSISEEPFDDVLSLLPVVSAISYSLVPIISVIEGNCSQTCLLLSLPCHERWVYHYSVLHFDFRYQQDSSAKASDVEANTELMNSFVKKLFKTRTKVPTEILQNLFDKAFVFNAIAHIHFQQAFDHRWHLMCRE